MACFDWNDWIWVGQGSQQMFIVSSSVFFLACVWGVQGIRVSAYLKPLSKGKALQIVVGGRLFPGKHEGGTLCFFFSRVAFFWGKLLCHSGVGATR